MRVRAKAHAPDSASRLIIPAEIRERRDGITHDGVVLRITASKHA